MGACCSTHTLDHLLSQFGRAAVLAFVTGEHLLWRVAKRDDGGHWRGRRSADLRPSSHPALLEGGDLRRPVGHNTLIRIALDKRVPRGLGPAQRYERARARELIDIDVTRRGPDPTRPRAR